MGIENHNTPKRSSKLLPSIIFGINLVVVLYLFLANQESRSIISIQKNERKLDSLTIKSKEDEIVDLQSKFQKIIVENRALGLTIGVMESSVKELEKLKKDIKSGKIPLSVLDKRISSIQQKFRDGRLKTDSLYAKNKYLSYLKDSMNQASLRREDSLMKLLTDLKRQEDKWSHLKAENIKVMVLNGRGTTEKIRDRYKSKNVKGLKVFFTIANNPVAKHCNRNFYLKIESPSGELLLDNEFSRADKAGLDYTSKQTLYFTNTEQMVSFLYEVPNRLKPGKYNISMYSDDYKLGEEVLLLK